VAGIPIAVEIAPSNEAVSAAVHGQVNNARHIIGDGG